MFMVALINASALLKISDGYMRDQNYKFNNLGISSLFLLLWFWDISLLCI